MNEEEAIDCIYEHGIEYEDLNAAARELERIIKEERKNKRALKKEIREKKRDYDELMKEYHKRVTTIIKYEQTIQEIIDLAETEIDPNEKYIISGRILYDLVKAYIEEMKFTKTKKEERDDGRRSHKRAKGIQV